MTSNLQLAADRVRRAVTDSCQGLVDRESLVELVVLCAVTREHLLVIGPPGTAKSEAVRRIANRLGERYFEYLVGRFTEPTELFGPINLRKLKEGMVETDTLGMLPEAEVAFLDEIFLGSTAILNTLLGILNERTFRRGHTNVSCPLRVCVGASNRLPEDEQLAAFADRFLVRVFVEPIGDSGLEALLSAGWSREAKNAPATSSGDDMDTLTRAAFDMDLAPVRPLLAHAVRLLRSAGIELSDRRIVRTQRLVAGAAALAGRSQASDADLWPIVFALPTERAQHLGREVLREFLGRSENPTLLAAPAESSAGPRARGNRILRDGNAIMDGAPAEATALQAWRLRVEGLAREIDATFTAETLPADVAALRARVVEALSPSAIESA